MLLAFVLHTACLPFYPIGKPKSKTAKTGLVHMMSFSYFATSISFQLSLKFHCGASQSVIEKDDFKELQMNSSVFKTGSKSIFF